MIIGFTGTRFGPTAQQRMVIDAILLLCDEVHHGDCVGVDSYVHEKALMSSNHTIVVHPPLDTSRSLKTKSCEPFLFVNKALPYLQRNKKIVEACDILVGVPKTSLEQLRSGTWSTLRYAKRIGRYAIVINPDGETREYVT